MHEPRHETTLVQALRGLARLTIDAVSSTTDLVEAMHAHVASPPSFLRQSDEAARNGLISRIVYECIRTLNGGIGWSIDVALTPFASLPRRRPASPREAAVVAALNGVLGDHLETSANPLALRMCLRRGDRTLRLEREALVRIVPDATSRVVLLVHGLCMNDLQWRRRGHDHGAALARDLGWTPVYARYNSGRHVSQNGRELASHLEQLVASWPVPVDELAILGHSMGGLVARSAYHYAQGAGHGWPARLRHLVFLATPHHGAPLERGGHRLQTLVGRTPYAAPLARLGMIRSAGVTDLRHGNVVDEDWHDADRFTHGHDRRRHVPLPRDVACHALAATLGTRAGDARDRLFGDGFVPRASALGEHPDPARSLGFAPQRRWVGYRMNHWDVLDHPAVYEQIRRRLAGAALPALAAP